MINARSARYGSINCVVVDSAPDPAVAAVMCHGYGASGTDLVGLAAEWIERMQSPSAAIRFVFPEAPHTLEELGMPDGHAWWPINMSRLMEMVEANRFDELHHEVPPGIDQATERVSETIFAVQKELGGRAVPLVLGGFSQGAMLVINAALRGSIDPPKLLFLFSGTLVCRDLWQANLCRLEHTAVFQSHGVMDPLLPYSSAESLAELIRGGGIDLEFHSFMGQHTISSEAIAITARMLAEL
ncbi:MAG: lysophospholipase [Pirellulales bacterium]|nr:lysophospholipase [Pirellulales bacterium]